MVRQTVPRIHSPGLVPLALFGVIYAAAFAVSLTTRYGGGIACLWLANGVAGPVLAVRPVREWAPFLIVQFAIAAGLTGVHGLGPVAMVPMTVLNLSEGVVFALVMKRWAPVRDGTLRTLPQLLVLLLGGAGAAALTGIPAASVASAITGTSFWHNWTNWAAGHALGSIAFTPVALLVLSGDVASWWREATSTERSEAGVHAALVIAVSIFTFAQSLLPLAYLPLLPVMFATFRLGRIGAAVSMMILAPVAIGFTLRGAGPVALVIGNEAARLHMVQFFLASVVLTVLPAAADLRRRKDDADRLAASEERYRLVTENASDVIMTLDAQGTILFVSPSIEALGDFRVDRLLNSPALGLVVPKDRAEVVRAHQYAMRSPGETLTVEYRVRDDNRWVESRVRAIHSGDGGLSLICAIRDISKRKAAELELQRAARTDPLTGLGNRRMFNDALDRLVSVAARDCQTQACVAIFDIDHFKRVNDNCGHDGGDRVLLRFAQIASHSARSGDIVARLGGEEFGLVLAGLSMAEAELVCERLRHEFGREPTRLDDGGVAWATVSAGVARIQPFQTRDDVLRDADAALYTAKRTGRDRLVAAN